MLHNIAYYRYQRRKHINRKVRLVKELHYWHYKYEGELSKGKIHCSCPMCSQKTNNKGKNRLKHGNYYPSKNWKHSDLQKIESMDAAVADYERELLGYIPRISEVSADYDAFVSDEELDELIQSLPD